MQKLIGKPMAEFKITLLCIWTKDDGSFEKIKIPHEIKKTPSKLVERSHKKVNSSSKRKNESSKDVGKLSSINPTELCAKLEKTTMQESESGVTKKTPNQVKKSTGHSPKSLVKKTAAKNETDSLVEEEESLSQTNNLENNYPFKKVTTTPKQTPKKTTKTPRNIDTQVNVMSKQSPLLVEKPKLEEVSANKLEDEPMQVGLSLKLGVGTPRRSLRTPKPIKRTPEQKKLSVKKLTESTKTFTPKQTKPTPKRQSMRSKPQMESEDVEMDD